MIGEMRMKGGCKEEKKKLKTSQKKKILNQSIQWNSGTKKDKMKTSIMESRRVVFVVIAW